MKIKNSIFIFIGIFLFQTKVNALLPKLKKLSFVFILILFVTLTVQANDPCYRHFFAQAKKRPQPPVIRNLISRYFKPAVKRGLKIGLEVEFHGVTRERLIVELLKRFKGEIGGPGYIRFVPDAPIQITEVTIYNSSDGKQFKITRPIDPDSGYYVLEASWLRGEKRFLTRNAIADYLRDEHSISLIQSTKSSEIHNYGLKATVNGEVVIITILYIPEKKVLVVAKNMFYAADPNEATKMIQDMQSGKMKIVDFKTVVNETSLGTIRVTNEHMGLEISSDPFVYSRLPEFFKIIDLLQEMGAISILDNPPSNVRFGLDVNVDFDPDNIEAIKRLINWWNKHYREVIDYFKPHKSRLGWLKPYPDALVEEMNSANLRTRGELNQLFRRHMVRYYKSCALNLSHLLQDGSRNAIENRWFNFHLEDDAEVRLIEAVQFSMALVEMVLSGK